MNSQDLRVDHFQIYNVANRRVRRPVNLTGLFDRGPVKGELVFLDMFANPVMKNGEPLYDRNAHFNMYSLYSPEEEPMRVVWAENQFGSQKLLIGSPIRLLVPAYKQERGLGFPEELDHYKVYRVAEAPPMAMEVELEDQFGRRGARLLTALAYAVPVEKEYRDRRHPIFNKDVHLTIYRLSYWGLEKNIRVLDQFAGYGLGPTFYAYFLAVPGKFEAWEELREIG